RRKFRPRIIETLALARAWQAMIDAGEAKNALSLDKMQCRRNGGNGIDPWGAGSTIMDGNPGSTYATRRGRKRGRAVVVREAEKGSLACQPAIKWNEDNRYRRSVESCSGCYLPRVPVMETADTRQRDDPCIR
ncbi:MAG: hypothetical protein ABIJ56_16355, partial [Pseudomonadota bacterium]